LVVVAVVAGAGVAGTAAATTTTPAAGVATDVTAVSVRAAAADMVWAEHGEEF
jgi:hypothetical protein